MIDDILSDAICEIEDYQRKAPERYASEAPIIESVKEVMRGVMFEMQAAPLLEVYEESEIAACMEKCAKSLERSLGLKVSVNPVETMFWSMDVLSPTGTAIVRLIASFYPGPGGRKRFGVRYGHVAFPLLAELNLGNHF